MRKTRERYNMQGFSLSFLDCICCGFGAIILLLVLTKIGEPRALEDLRIHLEGLVAQLQEEIFEIRGETNVLNRDMITKQEQVSLERVLLARLRGDLSRIQGEYAATSQLSEVNEIVEGRLLAAQQKLTEEMQRLLGENLSTREGGCHHRRYPGRQRIHHLHYRHLRQHAQLRLASGDPEDAGSPRCLPESQRDPGDERHGELHVHELRRQVDPRHARPTPDHHRPPTSMDSFQQLESRRRHHPGYPYLCEGRQEDQSLCLWR